MIYPNQKKAGKEVLSIFSKYSRYVILVAQMQSGKTGTCKYITKKLIKKWEFAPSNCWYICGMNDNDLLAQTCTEFKKILPRKNILYSKGLQKFNTIENNATLHGNIFIIIDESHYAGYIDSQVDLFVNKMTSNDGNIYLLSVSATPMAEIVSAKELNKRCITLIPDTGYYGISELYKAGLLFQSANICTDFEAFSNDIIAEHERQRATKKWKYCIVRLPNHWYTNDICEDIKALCRGVKFINCHYSEEINDSAINTHDFNDYIKDPPKKMTIIWIYNSLRAGKQLNTKHVGMVYDTNSSGTDTTAQALLGRILGYNKRDDRVRCYCNMAAALRMLAWITSDFSDTCVPIKSRGIVAKELNHNNWVQHVPIIVKLQEEYIAIFRALKLKYGNRYKYKNDVKSAILESASMQDFCPDTHKKLCLILSDEYSDGRYGGLMILTEYNADRSFKEHWESNYKKSKKGEIIRGFEVGAEQITAECNKFCYIFVNLHKYSKSYGKCILCYKEYQEDSTEIGTCVRLLPMSRYCSSES
jgi:hypothetical protein